ncbi:hypothetical protein [Mesorhizobium sp. LSJC264A00]|uniref:hypothetical protein n=1 Tax=unclassified Mesorhizobium TaxID=325217 RepID=UPI0012EC4AFA|nr:hypothetical protein [Mesorhizobium sp. LSJC264A00]
MAKIFGLGAEGLGHWHVVRVSAPSSPHRQPAVLRFGQAGTAWARTRILAFLPNMKVAWQIEKADIVPSGSPANDLTALAGPVSWQT